MVDYCANSLTLRPDEREKTNATLNQALRQIAEAARRLDVPVNVYQGGSVALREPAVLLHRDSFVRVKSDLDLFVVVRDSNEIPRAGALLAATQDLQNEVHHSYHFVPANVPMRLQGFASAYTVWLGSDRPVHESFPRPALKTPPQAEPFDAFFLFLGRLAKHLFKFYITTHWQKSGVDAVPSGQYSYQALKMMLDGLVMQYYGRRPGLAGLHPVAALLPEGIYDEILPRETIWAVLEARERFDPERPLPDVDETLFVPAVLRGYFGLPPAADWETIIEEARRRHFPQDNPLDLMPLVFLGHAAALLSPSPQTAGLLVDLAGQLADRIPTGSRAAGPAGTILEAARASLRTGGAAPLAAAGEAGAVLAHIHLSTVSPLATKQN